MIKTFHFNPESQKHSALLFRHVRYMLLPVVTSWENILAKTAVKENWREKQILYHFAFNSVLKKRAQNQH